MVVLDTIGDAPSGMNTIGATQWRGGAMAARHLTGLGHERIALVSGPMELTCCRARFGGYLAALRETAPLSLPPLPPPSPSPPPTTSTPPGPQRPR